MKRLLCILAVLIPLCGSAFGAEITVSEQAYSGADLYVEVMTAAPHADAGKYWRTTDSTWQAIGDTRDDFDLPLTETPAGQGKFERDLPTSAEFINRPICWWIKVRVGAAAAKDDPIVWENLTPTYWDGAALGMNVARIKSTDASQAIEQAVEDVINGATIDFADGTLDQMAEATWDALLGGIFTEGSVGKLIKDNLDAKVSMVGVAAVSPFLVDPDHTWRFDARNQTTAGNILTENLLFHDLVAMDFTEPMPAEAVTGSVTSVTISPVTGGAVVAPTLGPATLQANKKKVNILVDATLATAGKYTITVKIMHSGGGTLVRKGVLELK